MYQETTRQIERERERAGYKRLPLQPVAREINRMGEPGLQRKRGKGSREDDGRDPFGGGSDAARAGN